MRIGLIAPPWIPVPPSATAAPRLSSTTSPAGWPSSAMTCGCSPSVSPPARCPGIGCTRRRRAHGCHRRGGRACPGRLRGAGRRRYHPRPHGPWTAAGPPARDARPPVVTTHHGRVHPENLPILAEIAKRRGDRRDLARPGPSCGGVPMTAVIHHGIDLDLYQPGPGDGGYLLFMGRMSPDKGVHHAVRTARRPGGRWALTKIREARSRTTSPG